MREGRSKSWELCWHCCRPVCSAFNRDNDFSYFTRERGILSLVSKFCTILGNPHKIFYHMRWTLTFIVLLFLIVEFCSERGTAFLFNVLFKFWSLSLFSHVKTEDKASSQIFCHFVSSDDRPRMSHMQYIVTQFLRKIRIYAIYCNTILKEKSHTCNIL